MVGTSAWRDCGNSTRSTGGFKRPLFGSSGLFCAHVAIKRLDNVLIVVQDMDAARAFFAEVGMEVEAETQVEGDWVDATIGLEGVRADIVVMRTPDGHGKVELSRYHT